MVNRISDIAYSDGLVSNLTPAALTVLHHHMRT